MAATLAVLLQGQATAACNCPAPRPDTSGFLHLSKDGKLALPENALGVLFWKKLGPQDPQQGQEGQPDPA
ncbi:hypothetical protein LP420_21925 [Massilia sp. B-10]|nr:hypothetical protein LP420_21925 [Massilia sp. B-10]UUZ52179.1 hypothetical protein LP419_21385 [Massilia sp. H-1]